MSGVGQRLKHERETRHTTIEELAVATGIGKNYLEALEREEIDALPGPAFGKLYIRAYAEILGFDAQPWIEDYDREQRRARSNLAEPALVEPSRPRPVADAIARWKAERASAEQAVAEPAEPDIEPAEDVPAVEPSEAPVVPAAANAQAKKRRLAPLGLVAIVAIAFAIYFGMRPADGDRRDEPTPVRETPSAPESPPPDLRSPEPPPPVVAEPEKPVVRPPVIRQTRAGALDVKEFGVGRRMVKGSLEGEGDRFEPWARVSFATRVTGGERGAVVRHVWLYEGRVEQTITLRLGGPDWRTHSTKTLGRAGAWAVEARDDKGGVLARVEFNCGP
jgi:transcriptional regulator with XRE-family HTH domain